MSKELRTLRYDLGLTQEQLAVRLGVTVVTINRWENGRAKPSPLALDKIQQLINTQNTCETNG
jgi:putative transcriptional regulator